MRVLVRGSLCEILKFLVDERFSSLLTSVDGIRFLMLLQYNGIRWTIASYVAGNDEFARQFLSGETQGRTVFGARSASAGARARAFDECVEIWVIS